MYAIPGFVALMALWINTKRKQSDNQFGAIIPILVLGILGLLLQGIPDTTTIIVGRIIYGWAIFQGVVKFDVLLFELSTPDSYAMDYSKVHFFQNLGVLLSSFSVGLLVEYNGLQIPFIIALGGFVITLLLYYFIFKIGVKRISKLLLKS